MIQQVIFLDRWNWAVRAFYEAEASDADRILKELELIGCDGKRLRKAEDNLMSGERNNGLTYSNVHDRTTVLVICRTTSADEFQDTLDHEKMHCAFHIAGALGIDPYSEEFGYLCGEIGRQVFRVAKRFMCDCCRKRLFSSKPLS